MNAPSASLYRTLYSCAISSQPEHAIATLSSLEYLLDQRQINCLIDIRRPNLLDDSDSDFSQANLRQLAESRNIAYHWAGRQFANNFIPSEEGPDRALPVQLRGFAQYMRSDRFAMAIRQLLQLCQSSRCLLLSDIVNMQHCTRRLIADYLILQGHRVIHLLGDNETMEHPLSAEMRRESVQPIYDRFLQ